VGVFRRRRNAICHAEDKAGILRTSGRVAETKANKRSMCIGLQVFARALACGNEPRAQRPMAVYGSRDVTLATWHPDAEEAAAAARAAAARAEEGASSLAEPRRWTHEEHDFCRGTIYYYSNQIEEDKLLGIYKGCMLILSQQRLLIGKQGCWRRRLHSRFGLMFG
jgi:hypothetical protein